MSSSQAYLGAFESNERVQITLDKESLDEMLSYLEMNIDVKLTPDQWKAVYAEIYKSDLVSDFMSGVIEIAEGVINA
jgi:hypothetical protein